MAESMKRDQSEQDRRREFAERRIRRAIRPKCLPLVLRKNRFLLLRKTGITPPRRCRSIRRSRAKVSIHRSWSVPPTSGCKRFLWTQISIGANPPIPNAKSQTFGDPACSLRRLAEHLRESGVSHENSQTMSLAQPSPPNERLAQITM